MLPARSDQWIEFHVRGWTIVRGALGATTVRGFRDAIERDLESQGVSLDACNTWPRGGARRVLECAPLGDAPHWNEMRCSQRLSCALDDVIGAGRWNLPVNARGADGTLAIRHWYCPIAFPETPPDCELGPLGSTKDVNLRPCAPSSCEPRRAELMSCADEATMRGPVTDSIEAAARWQPVNRRRFLSKGWHIDVGPGFPSAGVRSLNGDPRQGVVVLLVLSDCAAGAGGTAMIPYSHFWVADALEAAPAGLRHEDLNTAFVRALRVLTERGQVTLPCRCGSDAFLSNRNERCHGDARATGCINVEQIVASAGDVVLVHPLLLHSGTTNLSTSPRLLANGVACVRPLHHEAVYTCPILSSLHEARARLSADHLSKWNADCRAVRPVVSSMVTSDYDAGSEFTGQSIRVVCRGPESPPRG